MELIWALYISFLCKTKQSTDAMINKAASVKNTFLKHAEPLQSSVQKKDTNPVEHKKEPIIGAKSVRPKLEPK